MLGDDDQARVGRGVDLPQPFGQVADGGLRIVGEPEEEAAGDHRLAAQVRIAAAAAEGHHPIEQLEGVPEALLIAAQRSLEQEDVRLFHRIAGAALERPLGAGEALLRGAEIAADAQRVAELRRGARPEVVDPCLAIDGAVEVSGDLDGELQQLQRLPRILEPPLPGRLQDQTAQGPGLIARLAGRPLAPELHGRLHQLAQQLLSRRPLRLQRRLPLARPCARSPRRRRHSRDRRARPPRSPSPVSATAPTPAAGART